MAENEKLLSPLIDFSAKSLHTQLHNLIKEIDGVRIADDPEYVHRMRVASRRLRTRLALFSQYLPDKKGELYIKQIRMITKSLGQARDTDVQIIFVNDFLSSVTEKPEQIGIKRLTLRLMQHRSKLQKKLLNILDEVEKSGILPDMQETFYSLLYGKAGHDLGQSLYELARTEIFNRLMELFKFENFIRDPENITELHNMRITAKHLRYSMETFAPIYPDKLKKPIKTIKVMQEMLGDIHDCYVWISFLPTFLEKEKNRSKKFYGHSHRIARLNPGLDMLRKDREKQRNKRYQEFIAFWDANKSTWDELHHNLNIPRQIEKKAKTLDFDQCAKTALKLGRINGFEENHAKQVTKLSLALFDSLYALHSLSGNERTLLAFSAMLHDIGLSKATQRHNKHSMEMILAEDIPVIDLHHQMMAALIAYYHRKVLPSTNHLRFMALSPLDRQTVRVLAAILRVADGLDRTHEGLVESLACFISTKLIHIECTLKGEALEECLYGSVKGDLMREVFGRELIIASKSSGPKLKG